MITTDPLVHLSHLDTLDMKPEAPAEASFGRERTVFLNVYTGEVLGEGSHQVRAFFRTVTDWHRWLGAKGDNRNVARAITGARLKKTPAIRSWKGRSLRSTVVIRT